MMVAMLTIISMLKCWVLSTQVYALALAVRPQLCPGHQRHADFECKGDVADPARFCLTAATALALTMVVLHALLGSKLGHGRYARWHKPGHVCMHCADGRPLNFHEVLTDHPHLPAGMDPQTNMAPSVSASTAVSTVC